MAYNVESLDLAAATANQTTGNQLMGRGERFSEVVALNVPEGNSFQLRYGTNPWFTVPRAFTSKPRGSDGNEGLYWRNVAAQPGVVVELIVTRGGAELGVELA